MNPTRTETPNTPITLRIGHGEKLHAGLATMIVDNYRVSYTRITFTCTCSGCRSGRALQRASVVAKGHAMVTCGGSDYRVDGAS